MADKELFIPIQSNILTDDSIKQVKIEWRKDGYGKENQALFIGQICVGHIMEIDRHSKSWWRAWLMTDDESDEVGRFDTADEARICLENKFKEALYA